MSQDWNQSPQQNLPPSGFGQPQQGAPFGAPGPGGGVPPAGGPMGGGPMGGGPMGGGPMGGAENNLALASLICGGVSVASLICCCIPLLNYASYVIVPCCGLAAIITGILGLREANQTGVRKNEAIAGIVLGSVGFVMIAIAIVLAIVGIGAAAAFGGMQGMR